MNSYRILLGGLIAGLIMNAGEATLHAALLGDEARQLYEKFGVVIPGGTGNLVQLSAMTFVLGIAGVWVYAAIRPRFGAGPRTALIAGVAIWLVAHLWSGVYLGAGYAGLIPPRLAWTPVVWGFLEAPIAILVGAAFYKEN